MPRDRDGQQNQDEFSLDAILAEFGSGQRQEEPPAAPFDASEEEAVEEHEEREASALAAEKALRAEAERELRK